jgi:L-arabinokinase
VSSILFYVTGHGYGHAVRSNEVIRSLKRLRPELKVHVRTEASEWLFQDGLSPVSHASLGIDVGVVQKDSLRMEMGATLQACQALHRRIPVLLGQETDFIKSKNIKLVLGDIPPLAFEIAARAGVQSVAIGNFTWDFIYKAYTREQPAFLPLIEEMRSFYQKATLALTLPYPCTMDAFPQQEQIPWIARVSKLSKDAARAKFKLPPQATVVLLSFGGFGLRRFPWKSLEGIDEFFFVTTGEVGVQNRNLRILSQAQPDYQDLVRAADAIVTKPGYGIVADVLAHRIPTLCTEREGFPEYPRLAEALTDLATAEFIPQEELFSGNVVPYLKRLLRKAKHWPQISMEGAPAAAKRILTMLGP